MLHSAGDAWSVCSTPILLSTGQFIKLGVYDGREHNFSQSLIIPQFIIAWSEIDQKYLTLASEQSSIVEWLNQGYVVFAIWWKEVKMILSENMKYFHPAEYEGY